MDELNSWDRWYRRKGKALLEGLEKGRKAAVRDLWIAIAAVIVGTVLSVVQFGLGSMTYPLAAMPLLLAVIVSFSRHRFQVQYKTALMPKLIRRLGGNFTYSARGKVDRAAFDQCGLFYRPVSIGGYQGEDLLVGDVGGTRLSLSELSISVPSGDTTVTMFQGLFLHAPLQDYAGVRLTVALNNWVRLMSMSTREPEGLDPRIDFDGAFGARFQVLGTSEADARRILTPEFQARMMAFAAQTSALGKEEQQAPTADWQYAFKVEGYSEPSMALSLVDNQLCIAIQVGKDLFDPGLFRPADHPGTVQRYMACLELLTGVLGALGFVVEDEPEAVAI